MCTEGVASELTSSRRFRLVFHHFCKAHNGSDVTSCHTHEPTNTQASVNSSQRSVNYSWGLVRGATSSTPWHAPRQEQTTKPVTKGKWKFLHSFRAYTDSSTVEPADCDLPWCMTSHASLMAADEVNKCHCFHTAACFKQNEVARILTALILIPIQTMDPDCSCMMIQGAITTERSSQIDRITTALKADTCQRSTSQLREPHTSLPVAFETLVCSWWEINQRINCAMIR